MNVFTYLPAAQETFLVRTFAWFAHQDSRLLHHQLLQGHLPDLRSALLDFVRVFYQAYSCANGSSFDQTGSLVTTQPLKSSSVHKQDEIARCTNLSHPTEKTNRKSV